MAAQDAYHCRACDRRAHGWEIDRADGHCPHCGTGAEDLIHEDCLDPEAAPP